MCCIPSRVERHRNTLVDFAEEMGKGGNQTLSMLTDLFTSLGQNFHFQGEREHFAQVFGIGAKPRCATAIRVSSLPYWKVGGDFLCQQKAEEPALPSLGTWDDLGNASAQGVPWGGAAGEDAEKVSVRHGMYPKTS